MYGTNIKHAFVEKLDLDYECRNDLSEGNGIRLDSVDAYDNKNQKIYTGLQSEFFGTDFNDDKSFEERYSCKCKKYIGKQYLGKVCEKCNTPVDYVGIDLKKVGWIILNDFKVMGPILYKKLDEALGSTMGDRVINKILDIKFDENGYVPRNDKEEAELKKHPFCFKGMQWLQKNLDVVLDYYEKKKPTKKELFKELREDYDKIFTSCIPVINAILRVELPGGENGNKLFKLKINTYYQALIRLSNKINEYDVCDLNQYDNRDIDKLLFGMQKEIDSLFEEIFNALDNKNGVLFGKVLSGKYNWSCRNVIGPSSGRLRSNEIELCYISAMELFRYETINYYTQMKNCSVMQASRKWKAALIDFDPIFYNILCHIIKKRKYINIMINRNPSINYMSFCLMKIKRIKKDIDDKTLTIPTSIIKAMGADWTYLKSGSARQVIVYKNISANIEKMVCILLHKVC